MLEGRGDNFDGVSTDRLKLELPEEMDLREKRNLENEVKDCALRLEQESKLATGPTMSAVHTLLKCLREAAVGIKGGKVPSFFIWKVKKKIYNFYKKISGSYQVSQRKQMDQLHKMKENLVKTVRCNSENQKTMNAMRGPVKKISRSSRLSKLNL